MNAIYTAMPRSWVHVKAVSVLTKAGSTPLVKIKLSTDISEHIGSVTSKDF